MSCHGDATAAEGRPGRCPLCGTPYPRPRGRETSNVLTEARTVLSRAETARDAVVWDSYKGNVTRGPDDWRRDWPGEEMPAWYAHGPSGEIPDPDAEAIFAALDDVVRRLDPYRRTGRPKRGRL